MLIPKVLNMRDIEVWKDCVEPVVRIDRGTPWGNPYIGGIDGNRDEVCDKHLEWLNKWVEFKQEVKITIGRMTYSNKWVIENVHLLRGKHPICWCSPERCHGDTLIRLANI